MTRILRAAALTILFALFAQGVTFAFAGEDVTQADLDAIAKHRDEVKVPASLFPDAPFVRLYACRCGIDADKMLAHNTGWSKSVPLTDHEKAIVRSSVFYAPPAFIFGCYFPRQYAFLFFDSGRKLVGLVAINFKAWEADIVPAEPPSPDFADIAFDRPKLWAIVMSHHSRLRQLGC